MISLHLQNATKTLHELIETTQRDIDDIKAARHMAVLERARTKEELLGSFERHKEMLDDAFARAMMEQPGAELSEILDESQHEGLGNMRKALEKLRENNRRFASLVIAVSEFYGSLLNAILPSEQVDYSPERGRDSTPSFLQVRG
jgi:hypothetical protein